MLASSIYKKPFTVCIEGNIASGKSTFLANFKQCTDIMVLEEPVQFWRDINGINLFNLMYKQPERYSCVFQSYAQLTFLKLHVQQTSLSMKIMERSIHSTRCFIEHMKRMKKMEKVEVSVLEKWNEWCLKNYCINLDLIVYLRTSPEIVYERTKMRARKEEENLSLDYLTSIHTIHEDWLLHRTLFSVPAPVIILNANQSLDEMLIEFQLCKNNIYLKHFNETIYEKQFKNVKH